MSDLRRILDNQKEVKYLTYFVIYNKDESITLTLNSLGINKNYKFRSENDCLSNIIDILFELKSLEKWMEQKLLKEKK